MNPSARPQTSRNRDRALARVTSITTQTAIVASIATVGFGGLAAFTYSGTTDASGTDTTTQSTTSVDGTTNNANQNSTDNTTSGSTSNNTTSGLQATQAPTTSTRSRARVTSGGSH